MPPFRTPLALFALLLALLLGALGADSASAQCVNGTACNDNSVCTTNDTCVNNVCVGTTITCTDDANVCTTAVCNPTLGCQLVFNSNPCDDGNLCTLNDFCSAGTCRAGNPKNCSDSNVCTDDVCDAGTGACAHANNTASCSDGNVCTTGDFCSGGACQVGPTPLSCDDANACTTDSCSPATGCIHPAVTNGTTCSDSSLCTTSDRCNNGLCVGNAVTCPDDSNVCTTASCSATLGCQQINNTAACDDGSLCSLGDVCSGGACQPGPPKNCSDSNVCTDDLCTPATGACSHASNTASCSDGNACTTGDLCSGGACQPGTGQLACSDANACTTDTCNPATGCVFPAAPNGTNCSDGSLCTTGDSCSNGSCTGATVTCPEDTNGCTTATCNPSTGCGLTNNTLPCDDANPCSLGDVCSNGVCRPGTPKSCSDGNDCTTDQCNLADGSCNHANNTLACNDGNACTPNDACSNGVCLPGGPALNCDNGNNPCQIGSCDAVLGCVFANAPPGTTCSDGNTCTSGDACSNGLCVGTPIGGCNPAAVPSMTDWGRIALVVLLAGTALAAGARWQRTPKT